MTFNATTVTVVPRDKPRRTVAIFKKLRGLIGFAEASEQGRECDYCEAVAKARATLVDAIDTGFTIEDTGKHVRPSKITRALFRGALGKYSDI